MNVARINTTGQEWSQDSVAVYDYNWPLSFYAIEFCFTLLYDPLLIIISKSSCSVTHMLSGIETQNFLALQQTFSTSVFISAQSPHLQNSLTLLVLAWTETASL